MLSNLRPLGGRLETARVAACLQSRVFDKQTNKLIKISGNVSIRHLWYVFTWIKRELIGESHRNFNRRKKSRTSVWGCHSILKVMDSFLEDFVKKNAWKKDKRWKWCVRSECLTESWVSFKLLGRENESLCKRTCLCPLGKSHFNRKGKKITRLKWVHLIR